MRRLVFWVFLAVAFLAASPKSASAQALVVPLVYSMERGSIDALALGGIHFPLISPGRLSVGPSFLVGGLWDKSDPVRPEKRHVHLTWMPAVQANVRLIGSFGITGGVGWGFLKKDAKTHISNYKTAFLGVALGLP